MRGSLLFESLQFLDEELLEACEEARERPRPVLRWGALAACCVLAAGAALVLPRLKPSAPIPAPGVSAAPLETPDTSPGVGKLDVQPRPGGELPPAPGPAAEPEPLYWNDLPELPAVLGSLWGRPGGYLRVPDQGQPSAAGTLVRGRTRRPGRLYQFLTIVCNLRE